jgi:hypothetical protein
MALIDAGATITATALDCHVCEKTVSDWIKRREIQGTAVALPLGRGRKVDRDEFRQILTDRPTITTSELMVRFGVSESFVNALKRKMGLATAPARPKKPIGNDKVFGNQSPKEAKLVLTTLTEIFADDDMGGDPHRRAIEFMRACPGGTLVIPTLPVIERMATDRQISRSVQADPSKTNVKRLRDFHGLSPRAYRTMSVIVQSATGQSITQLREADAARTPYQDTPSV